MIVMFSRIDDIICFVKKKDSSTFFLHTITDKFLLHSLNNFHKNIKFTFEVDIGNSIFRCSKKE